MSGASFADLSVLVIDDEPFTRMVMEKVVQSLGFKAVHATADGESGLATLQSHQVHVLICDMDMRPLSGMDVLKQRRQEEQIKNLSVLPVLFISNRVEPEVQQEAEALGSVAFLSKPVQAPSLREALQSLLNPDAPLS